MNLSAPAPEYRPQARDGGIRPRISVVILSRGPAQQLERAVSCVSEALRGRDAQLIIAREDDDPSRERVKHLAQQYRCTMALLDTGSGRHALTDEAMKLVTGDIVAVREDVQVRDAAWLLPFGCSVPVSIATDVEVPTAVVDEGVLRHAPHERVSRPDPRRHELFEESRA